MLSGAEWLRIMKCTLGFKILPTSVNTNAQNAQSDVTPPLLRHSFSCRSHACAAVPVFLSLLEDESIPPKFDIDDTSVDAPSSVDELDLQIDSSSANAELS